MPSDGRSENLLLLMVVILDADGKIIASKSENWSGIMQFDIIYDKDWNTFGMGICGRLT